jgi:hypothetical protein
MLSGLKAGDRLFMMSPLLETFVMLFDALSPASSVPSCVSFPDGCFIFLSSSSVFLSFVS